tara:strand:+ start:287 stop:514 length:228 start_codon:yes stop_codon:yes gene_type:complete
MKREKSLLELKSVGSYLDYETSIIYPMNDDGSADREMGISLKKDEVSSEWLESLNKEDRYSCMNSLTIYNPLNEI